MKDLKIKVNSEAESKEVQDFAKSDGYSRKYNNFTLHKGWVCLNSEKDILCVCHSQAGNELDDYKEITLPELRDLVVLKRNSIDDATHTDGHYSFYVGKDKNYFFSSCDKAWRGTWKNVDILKPIEKPMKEYLRKNNDGEYILEVTDEREAQEPHAKHWIEVPKGCDYLISAFGVNSFIDSDVFAKVKPKNVLWSRKPMKEYLNKETYEYKKSVDMGGHSKWIEIPEGAEKATLCNGYLIFWKNEVESFSEKDGDESWASGGDNMSFSEYMATHDDISIVWRRHTHPEELPFIDDEPKITTAKGSELDYIAKIHDMRDRYDGESDEDYRYQLEHYISRKEPSLNDQYAEIEKVRQSHRTASEIADSALKHIRERAETYDQPTGERSAAKTAKAFNAITGKDITESEVWLLLQLLKDVRQWSREDYHQDSAEDCIAYAALKAESLEGGE